jgi:hypothetical protein
MTIAACAGTGAPVSAAAAAPRAQAARTLDVRDEGHLRFIKGAGSQLIDEGRVSGTFPGWVKVRFTYNGEPNVSASLTIYGHGGTISARGSGRLSSPTSPDPSFRGRMYATGGSGRYAHVHGRGEIFGVFHRRSYGLVVQAIGRSDTERRRPRQREGRCSGRSRGRARRAADRPRATARATWVTDPPWRLVATAPARRDLDRLPTSVTAVVLETLTAIAEKPHAGWKASRLGARGSVLSSTRPVQDHLRAARAGATRPRDRDKTSPRYLPATLTAHPAARGGPVPCLAPHRGLHCPPDGRGLSSERWLRARCRRRVGGCLLRYLDERIPRFSLRDREDLAGSRPSRGP